MDIGPAVLEMAGVEVPEKTAAQSLLPAIEGGDWVEREYMFAEQGRDTNFTESRYETMVRSHDWKLVHFVDSDDGQLFDLNADPDEVRNLWNSPEHQPRKQELLQVIQRWRTESSYEHSGCRAKWPPNRA